MESPAVGHFIYVTPVFAQDVPFAQALTINLFRWCIGFLGCWAVLTMTAAVMAALKTPTKKLRLMDWISWLGENSLAVYCLSIPLHSYYLPRIYGYIMGLAGGNLFARNMAVYDFLFTPILSVAFCVGLYILIEGMKKLKVHAFLFGR